MWPFKKTKKNTPDLEFTRRTYPYRDGRSTLCMTIIHTGRVIRGHIKETEYGTWEIDLCGNKAARFTYDEAKQSVVDKWSEWYQ